MASIRSAASTAPGATASWMASNRSPASRSFASTARDAAFHDYYVVLTSDAMASDVLAWHEASVLTMSGRHDMLPWRTLVHLWEENQHDSDGTRRPAYETGRRVATT